MVERGHGQEGAGRLGWVGAIALDGHDEIPLGAADAGVGERGAEQLLVARSALVHGDHDQAPSGEVIAMGQTKAMRPYGIKCKACVLGANYGMGYKTLAMRIGADLSSEASSEDDGGASHGVSQVGRRVPVAGHAD